MGVIIGLLESADPRSIPKYRRYEKRHKNLAAHCSPAFRVEQGDQVTVGEYS
jgi:ribosomal protein S17